MKLKEFNDIYKPMGVRLHQGKGYLYFVNDAPDSFDTKSVMVAKFGHLAIDQWHQEAMDFAKGISE